MGAVGVGAGFRVLAESWFLGPAQDDQGLHPSKDEPNTRPVWKGWSAEQILQDIYAFKMISRWSPFA